jgi:repressor LexA
MNQLTQRQKEILDFIASYQSRRGFSPTYQEIADHFSLASKFGVARHIDALIKKGRLEKTPESARSLRVIHSNLLPPPADYGESVRLPLLGRVAAGGTILSGELVEEWLTLPARMAKNDRDYFTVRVQGDSMTGAGIFDGDVVIVKKSSRASAGSVVVALVEGEVTVKRLMSKNGKKYLQAENPDYFDIHPAGEWQIQGEVTGLIRTRIN